MLTLSKLKLHTAVLVAALTMALVSPASRAQSSSMQNGVDIPFAFTVGSTHFAPGRYILTHPWEHLLVVQGATRSAQTMSSYEINLTPSGTSKVVFHRYGNQYFLREVWTKGNVDHLYCPESKAEHEAERTESGDERAATPTQNNVEIALLGSRHGGNAPSTNGRQPQR